MDKKKKHWNDWLWDGWCILSLIGIWPRFIEPRLLSVNHIKLSLNHLPSEWEGLRLLHFSDLHWGSHLTARYQKKIIAKVRMLKPDLIFFTGDFLCRAKLENGEGLKIFLNALKAPYGCFAVLGNHDYSEFVTINGEGDYDIEQPSKHSTILKGFQRLFNSKPLTKQFSERVKRLEGHSQLEKLLKETPFHLMKNQTEQIKVKGHTFNICGLEDYWAGKFSPSQAFQDYDPRYPGVVLSHNPDTFPLLKNYPGDLILSGHTHGGQINLPWIEKKLNRRENREYKRGLKKLDKKWGYINRGISGIMKFRWFSSPEITLIRLTR